MLHVCEDFVQDDSFVIQVSHNPVIDITGAVFEFTLKTCDDSAESVLYTSYTCPVDANSTGGIALIPITRELTSDVDPGEYIGSLKRTMGTDTKTLLRTGKPQIVNNEVVDVARVICYQTLTEQV